MVIASFCLLHTFALNDSIHTLSIESGYKKLKYEKLLKHQALKLVVNECNFLYSTAINRKSSIRHSFLYSFIYICEESKSALWALSGRLLASAGASVCFSPSEQVEQVKTKN